jgi:hypothetical protein
MPTREFKPNQDLLKSCRLPKGYCLQFLEALTALEYSNTIPSNLLEISAHSCSLRDQDLTTQQSLQGFTIENIGRRGESIMNADLPL